MPKWLKYSLRITIAFVLLVVAAAVGIMLYVTHNKQKVLKLVNTELNGSLDGTIIIGDLKPEFFHDFPRVSLELKNVQIRDKRFAEHHHTLLDAKEFYVSVNALSLLGGSVSIKRIDVDHASMYLYTDSTGYSNLSIIKKKPKKDIEPTTKTGVPPQLGKFSLSHVDLTVDDRHKSKLFHFVVNTIGGEMTGLDTGFKARFHMDLLAKSMSFKTTNGSFIKDKNLVGDFTAGFNEDNGKISLAAPALKIGPDVFKLSAVLGNATRPADFSIHLAADQITWKDASELLPTNIKRRLDLFTIDKPLAVNARIEGSFGGGDPFLYITAKVRDSKLTTPAAELDNCSFDGVFTNVYQKGKDSSDENSIIRLTNLTANYSHIPFTVDTGSIINLSNPLATGVFRANFPVQDMNSLFGKVARFTKGTADIMLRFKADIVNFELNRPIVSGYVNLKHANIIYMAENIKLVNSSISLNFVGNDLVMKNIRLQTGRSVVYMEGRANNFMNLYYSAPEKMLLSWQVRSPQLYLGEFLGVLAGSSDSTKAAAKKGNSGNIIDQLSTVLEKSRADMHLEVKNAHYNKFLATDVHADLLTSEDKIDIKNVGLKHAGGFLKLNGSIERGDDYNHVSLNTTISHVDVHEFFEAFDNFGLQDFTSANLQGYLSARTSITAGLTDAGSVVPGSLSGNLDVNLQQGVLLNFKPMTGIAKYAFPRRDLKNIKVPVMDAHFDVANDMITIHPLKFSSSVINMDIQGVYGLKKGTDLALDVPLRDPKKDSTINDAQKLAKKRYKGVVLHLHARADSTGKIKIGLGNKKDKE